MPNPSSLTLNYNAQLSTTLFNFRKTLEDQISKTNAFLFYVMRKKEGAYVSHAALGDRIQVPLMYEMGAADSYAGYDLLGSTPMEGITSAFFDWRQMAVAITISRIEERKNSGEFQMLNLLKAKTKQALLGIQDLFSKALIQGNGPNLATAITTPYTSTLNASTFIDPLALLIKFDPTTSTVIGNINQATYSWWRNQTLTDTSTTFAGFLKNLRKLYNNCGKGPGGNPDLHVTDQNSYELYEAALAAAHRNPSYQKADIPFDNIEFKGKPVTWDENTPDVSGGSTTQSTTSGSWWMINTEYWQLHYDKETNFITTPFERPIDQDAKLAHIMWYGAATVSNRRKNGVMGSIDSTITS